jgi:dihydroorotate dehydrogenase (fumarate)
MIMDLSTRFMGLELKNPVIVSSSELTATFSNIRRCADSGAGAVVMKSIFEEQIMDTMNLQLEKDNMYFWYPEAAEYIKTLSREHGIEEYILLIKNVKEYTDMPVIASINCTTPNQWPKFAASLEEAGADGIELNISIHAFNEFLSSEKIENTFIEIVTNVKKNARIPVAVKISPFFTNLMSLTTRLSRAGADALVLFNRYYRPDIDINNLKIISSNVFSAPEEITQSLRWVMLLSNKLDCDISASTGVHDYTGVIKQLLVGADTVQICSTLYKSGIEYVETIIKEMEDWMKREEVFSVNEFRGFLKKSEENTAAFERVQFMKKTTGEYVTY